MMKTIRNLITGLLLTLSLVGCNNDDENVVDIVNQAPNSFDLLKVADGAINIDVLPEFTWQAATDPDGDVVSYDLYLGTEANPTKLYKDNLASPNFKVQERLYLLNDYYWKVVAKDSKGNTTESNVSHFTTRNLNFYNNPITTAASFSGRYNHTNVVFDNKLWVIGGTDLSSYKNDVWYSTDGETWTEATASAQFSARSSHTTVVFDNKLWVIGGYDENFAFKNDVWYSTDGITWTEATASASFSGRYTHTSVVYDNKLWVIGGTDGSLKNDVWYSSDGVTWSEATASAQFSERTGHTTIVYDNKLWVIGGFSVSSRKKDIWFSTDGVSWTRSPAIDQFSKRTSHTSAVYDNKLWVIGGFDENNDLKNDMWSSNDGINWTEATDSAQFSGREDHTTIVYDNKLWVIGGLDSKPKNDVWVMD